MSDIKIHFVEKQLALNGNFFENWKAMSESRNFAERCIRNFDYTFDNWKTYTSFKQESTTDHFHLAMALFYFMQYRNGQKEMNISCKKQNGEEFLALFQDSGSSRFINISCFTFEGQIVRFRYYDG